MGISVDVTERKRAEQAYRASEARLEAGVELAGLAFYEVDFGAGAIYSTTGFATSAAFPRTGSRGFRPLEFWMEHLHPDDRPRVLELRQRLHDGRLERLFLEYRFLPAGPAAEVAPAHRPASRRAMPPDARSGRTASFGTSPNARRAEDELHDLSQRLIGAHEDERALLARELHDDVSQRLAVLAIDVGRVELASPDEAQAAAMQEVREGLVRLSEDIHSLAYQLHPSILEELGLAEALRAECERRERQGRLDLSADIDPLPAVIGKDAALCLFRVAQEALNNVARHAGVRAAERHAAADGRRIAARRLGRRRRLRSGASTERGCTSASRAWASACGW